MGPAQTTHATTAVLCPLCRSRPANSREHVWPQWLLRRADAAGPAPYSWTVGGKPVLDKNISPLQLGHRARILLAICEQCNGTLDTRFEHTAKPLIDPLIANAWSGTLSDVEWRAVGEWWAKVLLLLGHPRARYETPRLAGALIPFSPPLPDYMWLIDGSAPPDHLSLFVFRADLSSRTTAFRLAIPELVTGPAGEVDPCHVGALAMPGIAVALVSHPGIEIDHPLVRRGHAWELLHAAPSVGDLAALPLLSYQSVQMPRAGSVERGHVIDESAGSVLTTLLDPPGTPGAPGASGSRCRLIRRLWKPRGRS